MSKIIKRTPKNLYWLEQIFINAPKSYEDVLAMKKNTPAPEIGYNNLRKFESLTKELFEEHIKGECSCKDSLNCLYIQYYNKEITMKELFDTINLLS